MEYVKIDLEQLKGLNEDNLIMLLPPGRMGGDNALIVYKKDDKYFEYSIDGIEYSDEINAVFPKRKQTYEGFVENSLYPYHDDNYYAIDMGMGCHIYIRPEYFEDFILNAKILIEKNFGEELTFEQVIESSYYICGVWEEAANLTLNK